MLLCPHCNILIVPVPGNDWFDCPHCNLPVIKKVSQRGRAFLLPGSRVGNEIRPIQYQQALNNTESQKTSKPPVAVTIPPSLSLSELLIPPDKIIDKISEIGKRITSIENAEKEFKVPDSKNELDILRKRKIQLELQQAQLQQVKKYIGDAQDEWENHIQYKDNSGLASGCSAVLAIAGLYVFSLVGNIDWNWKTIGLGVIFVAVTAFFVKVTASP